MATVDAYAERKTAEVMRDTWGHMDAKPGVRYEGEIVFAAGAYGGECIILRAEFGAASYGPWFYEGVHAWLWEQEMEDGNVYRFTGSYTLGPDGSQAFSGDIALVDLAPAATQEQG